MKQRRFDFILAVIVLGALVLLGMALWYAILRPESNYRLLPGMLPQSGGIPDCMISAVYLLLTAFLCSVGSKHYDDTYYQTEGGGDAGCL